MRDIWLLGVTGKSTTIRTCEWFARVRPAKAVYATALAGRLTLADHEGLSSQAGEFALSPFIDNRCNTFKVDDMLRRVKE